MQNFSQIVSVVWPEIWIQQKSSVIQYTLALLKNWSAKILIHSETSRSYSWDWNFRLDSICLTSLNSLKSLNYETFRRPSLLSNAKEINHFSFDYYWAQATSVTNAGNDLFESTRIIYHCIFNFQRLWREYFA